MISRNFYSKQDYRLNINTKAPDLPHPAFSVNTVSYSFENVTNLAGAENPKLTHKSKIYLRIARNLLISFQFLVRKIHLMVPIKQKFLP